jgi:hypothetical protein
MRYPSILVVLNVYCSRCNRISLETWPVLLGAIQSEDHARPIVGYCYDAVHEAASASREVPNLNVSGFVNFQTCKVLGICQTDNFPSHVGPSRGQSTRTTGELPGRP